MAEKKNNMATRFCDEIVSSMEMQIDRIKIEARTKTSDAKALNAQIEILENRINLDRDLLVQGNYEKNDAQS